MKILVLSDGIPPFVMGGMQKHTQNLCKYLAISGHDVTLVHCVGFGESIPNDFEVGKAIFGSLNIPENFKSKGFNFPAPGKIPGHYIRASKKYSKQVYASVRNDVSSFDFIYVQGYVGDAFYKNTSRFSAKVGVNFHGLEMFQKQADSKSKLQSKLLKGTTREHLRNADFVFSLGGKLSSIIENEGVSPEKIIELPNAIDNNWLDNENEEIEVSETLRFLFVGRYERRKGVEELSEAINRYLENNGSAYFEFVGPIPDEKKIRHKQVKYYGKVMDVNKLKSIYRQNDILLCPSYSEGMPTVILEAMSQGLMVLATDVGATRLLVNKSTGWLLSDSSPKEILDKLKLVQLEKDQVLLKKEVARSLVYQNFTWNNIIEKTNKFLESIR